MISLTAVEGVFWLSVACVLYAYFFYPMLVALVARSWQHVSVSDVQFPVSVTVVLTVYNEESSVVRRIDEFVTLLSAAGCHGELIVVSDGSTDTTVDKVKSHASEVVRLVEITVNVGKAAALSRGCGEAKGEILVFADARQRWAGNALTHLLANFNRPEVGAVSGELILESESGVMAGMGLYWQYEKWLRRNEGLIHSTVGVSGSICAVRRELFRSIPQGTLLDDVYWPMNVVMQGYRVVHDETAIAFDRLPAKANDEFRRKVRTLSGNFQLVALLPEILLPWRNPIWIQFISHKIFRLLVPWALLAALLTSAFLKGGFYRTIFAAQLFFYLVGIAGVIFGERVNSRYLSVVTSFLVLNTAAWFGFWKWVTGQSAGTWGKVRYEEKGRA